MPKNAQTTTQLHSYHMLLLLLSRFSHVWLCVTPQTAAHQAPLSLGFSRQEHWSGCSFSPMHESEKWKWSRLVMSDPQRPHGLEGSSVHGFSRQEYWSGVPLSSPYHMLVSSKSSKLSFNSTWTENFQRYKLYLEKAEEPEIKFANIHWIIGKAREFQKKHLALFHWLCHSLWLCESQQTGKFFKRWEYQNLAASCETCMQVKKQQLEPVMEQQTGSK